MYRQLHRTALSVVFMCSLVTVSEAVMYTYQGPNYAILDGTRFTASDSLSGTMSINTPPFGGTCTGFGSSGGQCDITELTLLSSGSPPFGFDLSTHDTPFTLRDNWFFSFGLDGEISTYHVLLSDANVDSYIRTDNHLTIGGTNDVLAEPGSRASNFNDPGIWAIVPEPSTIAFFLWSGAALVGLSCRRR